MSKRKRGTDSSYIPGLTRNIIENIGASFSVSRGQELINNVIIDSHSNGSIEASIAGKHYEIEISYQNQVNNAFDIDCNCTCPDDRDGYCKHICAVLLTFIDKNPKRKRQKSDSSSNKNKKSKKKKKKHHTISELKKSVESLEKDQLLDIVKKSLKFAGVQKIVSNALNAISDEPIDLTHYKQRIYEAVHQLDRLRPSAQFSMSYKIHQDLDKIIGEAQNLFQVGNNNAAMQILITMSKSISNESNIEGEVWKSLHGCGGVDDSIALLMTQIIENDQEMQQNISVHKTIQSIHNKLTKYGIDEYQQVLETFDV